MACIYKITNLVNGKFYIGSTLRSFDLRKNEHIRYLNINKHFNNYLQFSWNKYGKNNFIFEILEHISIKDDIRNIELKWIKNLNPFYNIVKEVSPNKLGIKHTQESIKKMKTSHTGKKHSLETINKIRISNTGKKHSIETINKIKKTLNGRNVSPGYIRTEKHKIKLREQFNNRLNKMSEEDKNKRKINAKIATTSDEFRKSASIRSRNRNRKEFTCYKVSGEFVDIFTNQAEAAESLNLGRAVGISYVLNGKRKTHAGYIFKYN